MTPGSWCALVTLGCFATLASLSYGKYPPPKLVTSAEKRSVRHVAEPVAVVTPTKQPSAKHRYVVPTGPHGPSDFKSADAVKRLREPHPEEYQEAKRAECGADFYCLEGWAQ